MTRDEFEEKIVAVLGEAMKAGYLHKVVVMADTREHHAMLTNMGQKSTVRFLLHMAEHALDPRGEMVAYNLVTGEKHENASETFESGVPPKGRKKAH